MDLMKRVKPTAADAAPAPPPRAATLQRKCACGKHTPGGGECDGCKKKNASLALNEPGPLRRSAAARPGPEAVPPSVGEVLGSAGEPLDRATRAQMESRFGADFSRVRVHTDRRSAQSAWDVSALAYTVGSDIVFGAGQYRPGTGEGRRLLAHELAHVVQQQGAGHSLSPGVEPAGSASEHEADAVADAVVNMGGASGIALNVEPTQDASTLRASEAVVSRGGASRRVPLPNTPGYRLARAWDWKKSLCRAACWGLGAGITAIVAAACGVGSVVTIGGLAIPCTYAVVATAVAAGAGASLCSDLCDHALSPSETPAGAGTGGAGGAGGVPATPPASAPGR